MPKTNTPYEPGNSVDATQRQTPPNRSYLRSALVGFALGAALPIAYAAYGMYQGAVYRASLPEGENLASCGTGALAMFMMIIVGGPFFGAIGAAIAVMVTSVDRSSAWSYTYAAPRTTRRQALRKSSRNRGE